jgi:energy-coupling factor transporter ATP-binding protein EcfA2
MTGSPLAPATTPTSTPTLRWLQISRYEQFEPVRLTFSPHENLILGLNGAGKSQLLKLIRAILCLDFGELLRQPFAIEFGLSTTGPGGEAVRVEGHVVNTPPVQESDPDRPDVSRSDGLEATLTIQEGQRPVVLRIHEGMAHVDSEDARLPYRGDGVLVLPRRATAGGPRRDELVLRRGTCWVGESLEDFIALVERSRYELTHPASRVEGVTVTIDDRMRRWIYLPLPLVFVNVERWEEGISLDDHFTADIPAERMLADLLGPLDIEHIRLVPAVDEATADTSRCSGIKFHVFFRDGHTIKEPRLLAFGQKRYLYAGITSLFHPGAPIVGDELDNGMHPRLVRALLGIWEGRQLFLASHNKLLVDSTNFWSPRDVQEKLHILRREGGRQILRRFDDAVAAEIHANIEVKIQSPSDVLEAEGL